MFDEQRDYREQQSCEHHLFGTPLEFHPPPAAPGIRGRRDPSQHRNQPGCQHQADAEVIRQRQPEQSPHGQRIGGRSQVEDRAEHRKIRHEGGERHDADECRVVKSLLAASGELGADCQENRDRHQHAHLQRRRPVTHVSRQKQNHSRTQSDSAQRRRDLHSPRDLPLRFGGIDIELRSEFRQSPFDVRVQPRALLGC